MLCLIFGLARFGYVGRAQTFAADLKTTRAGEQSKAAVGHVYVSHGNVRIETPELADGFFLVDAKQPAVWFLRPRQRLFMDARRSSPLTQIFVRVDPGDACRQWQLMEQVAGAGPGGDDWRCDRLGRDIVDGHETLKYQVTTRGDRRSYRWIDPLRQFPIRLEDADGTVVSLDLIVDRRRSRRRSSPCRPATASSTRCSSSTRSSRATCGSSRTSRRRPTDRYAYRNRALKP